MDVLSLTPKESVRLSQVPEKGHGRQVCGTIKPCLSPVPKKSMTTVWVLHTATIRKITRSSYPANTTDHFLGQSVSSFPMIPKQSPIRKLHTLLITAWAAQCGGSWTLTSLKKQDRRW